MMSMKNRLNYGFPFSYIFLRLLVVLAMLLFVIGLIVIDVSIYAILIFCICFIPIYIYFDVIQFKKKFLENRKKLLEKIIEFADIKGDERVLDLGTGSGFLAIGFAKHLKNGKSYGLDRYSLKSSSFTKQIISIIKINFIGISIKNAKINAQIEKVENKCEFIETDLTKPFDFPKVFFDVIVSCQFFYCLTGKDRLNVLREIDRVLKQNGRIIFFESSSFMGWDILEVKGFFEKIGYKLEVIPSDDFNKCCILYGKKP